MTSKIVEQINKEKSTSEQAVSRQQCPQSASPQHTKTDSITDRCGLVDKNLQPFVCHFNTLKIHEFERMHAKCENYNL
jgi:hypothetical protein